MEIMVGKEYLCFLRTGSSIKKIKILKATKECFEVEVENDKNAFYLKKQFIFENEKTEEDKNWSFSIIEELMECYDSKEDCSKSEEPFFNNDVSKFENLHVDDNYLPGEYNYSQAQQQIRFLNGVKYKGFENWRMPLSIEFSYILEVLNVNQAIWFENIAKENIQELRKILLVR